MGQRKILSSEKVGGELWGIGNIYLVCRRLVFVLYSSHFVSYICLHIFMLTMAAVIHYVEAPCLSEVPHSPLLICSKMNTHLYHPLPLIRSSTDPYKGYLS